MRFVADGQRQAGGWRAAIEGTLAEATGRSHRSDPHRPGSGGPAGNARLTAWTGLGLLALFLAELVTLLDIRGLISWHLVIGALLLPPSLLKTASTGWRIARYYTGHRDYRTAGPPPTLLRLLGPGVVVSTLGLLATGIVLVALGPASSHDVLFALVGQRVDAVTLHQAFFAVWAVATGLHVLGRAFPAARLALGRSSPGGAVDGRAVRGGIGVLTAGLAALCAVLLLLAASGWRSGDWGFHGHERSDGLGRHAPR